MGDTWQEDSAYQKLGPLAAILRSGLLYLDLDVQKRSDYWNLGKPGARPCLILLAQSVKFVQNSDIAVCSWYTHDRRQRPGAALAPANLDPRARHVRTTGTGFVRQESTLLRRTTRVSSELPVKVIG
jgi:hypothetical protein